MDGDSTCNECVFKEILDICNINKKYSRKELSFVQKIQLNFVVKKEKINFIFRLKRIFRNCGITMIVIVLIRQRKKLFDT